MATAPVAHEAERRPTMSALATLIARPYVAVSEGRRGHSPVAHHPGRGLSGLRLVTPPRRMLVCLLKSRDGEVGVRSGRDGSDRAAASRTLRGLD
jgi:hypothetical protein